MPAEIAGVTWTCMANAEHSVYLPISGLITETAEAYAYDPDREETIYDPDMATVCYQRLCSPCRAGPRVLRRGRARILAPEGAGPD